jgi:hypothetical protein
MGDVIGDLNSRRGLVGEFLDKPGNMRVRMPPPLTAATGLWMRCLYLHMVLRQHHAWYAGALMESRFNGGCRRFFDGCSLARLISGQSIDAAACDVPARDDAKQMFLGLLNVFLQSLTVLLSARS